MAAQQPTDIKRIDLQQHDLSVPGREVVQVRVDLGPTAPFVKHTHPGEEIIYVLEGSLEYQVEGQPPTTVTAPPLTRILPAASRLMVVVLSSESPKTRL